MTTAAGTAPAAARPARCRVAAALGMGACAGLPGALLTGYGMAEPPFPAAIALLPVVLAALALDLWQRGGRDALRALGVAAVTIIAGLATALNEKGILLVVFGLLLLLPLSNEDRPRRLADLVTGVGPLTGFAAATWPALLPGYSRAPDAQVWLGVQVLLVVAVLYCALPCFAALAGFGVGLARNRWATGLAWTGLGMVLAGPFLAPWLPGVVREVLGMPALPWNTFDTVGCIGYLLAAAAIAAAGLGLATLVTARREGSAAASEEWAVLLAVAAATCWVLGWLAAGAVLVALQLAIFVTWIWRSMAWSVAFLRLAPGLAAGSATLFLRIAAEHALAWPVYGALVGAALALAPLNFALLRGLAATLFATRRWRACLGISAVLHGEEGDLAHARRAAECADRLDEPRAAAEWYERASDWEEAGVAWLTAARDESARRRPAP